MMTNLFTFRGLNSKWLVALFFLLQINIGFNQCPTILPTLSDTCFFGAQSVTLSATGSTNNYAGYDAITGGNFIGSGNPIDLGVVSSTSTFYVAAQEENTALDFDGTNDRVAIQNYSYNGTGMTELTVEAWVKTTSTSPMIIASFDRSDYWRLGISSTGASSGRVSWSVKTNSGILDMGGSSAVNDGQWHHVAGTFNAGTARVYVDGVLDGTVTLGTTWGSTSTRFGFIGVGSEASSFNGNTGPNHYMHGEIDELRVWSTERTVGELSSNMNNCLLGTETGLEIYYKLNDGTGSSLVTDEVSTSNGILVNMNANADWMTRSAIYSCPSCESVRVPVTITIDNSSPLSITGGGVSASCIGGIPTLDAGAGYSSYLWNTGATTQTVDASISGVYSVEVDNAGCSAKDSVNVKLEGGTAETSALFDGANDRAAIQGFTYNSTAITELSVEGWIKTTDAGNQIVASFDRSEYWRLGINGDGAGAGEVSWNLRTSTGILDFGSSTRVDDGKWHHIAGTYNAGVARIYIDGTLDATANGGPLLGSGAVRFGFIGTGSEASSFNGSRGPNSYFDGEIEELKIWSKELTISEIRDEMCKNYTGATADLEAYFKFNEGSGTELFSEVGSVSAQAISINTAAFWANSGAPIGDASVHTYPASWPGNSLAITSCSGTELTVSNITSVAEGAHLYVVEGTPSNLTGIDSFTVGNHYYGIFYPKSAAATYTAEIDYGSHPLVNTNNIQGLATLTREDKTALTFVQEEATNNTITEVISADLTDRKEIILDSYYYIWTGATNTDWAIGSNWDGGIVPPTEANILVPDVTNQPILDMNRIVANLKIQPNATVDLFGNRLEVIANLIADGTVISNAGILEFSGNVPQFFIVGAEQTIDNITSSNPVSVSMENRAVNLKNTLSISAGTFNTNDSLILISDAIATARIDEITGGGVITGEIEMQRYIDAGETYWRFFSSAVQGATVEDYQGDFITSGYVGSDFPSFPFTSVFTYDEGTGYTAVSNASQVINPGEGFMVWSGDTITGTDPFLVDYRGVPNQGNISMPVSLTNNDGWNLVGNPYASTIDWDSPDWTKTNMANSVYILNPDTEQYATYINGASANGGSRYIASQQAFWVGAIGNNPVLTATEAVKSPVDQAFFKSGSTISPGMSILLSGNNMTDEAVIRHVENTTDNYDSEFDAIKQFASWIEFPHISVLNTSNEDFTVHSFDKSFQEWSLPIRTIVFQDGDYELIFDDIHELDVPCIQLEDTYDGQFYMVEDGIPLSFTMSDTTYAPRFILHIGRTYDTGVIDALCKGELGAVNMLTDSSESGTYQLSSSSVNITGNFSGGININNLAAGNYTLTVTGLNNICQTNQFDIIVEEPTELLTQSVVSNEAAGQDGSIAIQVIGGTPDYTYLWSNGSVDSVISNLTAGNYSVVITDANNCEITKSFDLISVLGVDEVSSGTEFIYYAADNRIQLKGNLEQSYTLIDINGKIIEEYEIGIGLQEINMFLPPALAQGVYFLTGNNTTFKIVR